MWLYNALFVQVPCTPRGSKINLSSTVTRVQRRSGGRFSPLRPNAVLIRDHPPYSGYRGAIPSLRLVLANLLIAGDPSATPCVGPALRRRLKIGLYRDMGNSPEALGARHTLPRESRRGASGCAGRWLTGGTFDPAVGGNRIFPKELLRHRCTLAVNVVANDLQLPPGRRGVITVWPVAAVD